MSERGVVEEKLHRKEAEILSLEERLKAARTYVQALRDVLNALADSENGGESEPAEAALRAGSSVAMARDVILKRGAPVHVSDLLSAQGKASTRESRASLTSSLSAYVRRGGIFTRPAPNTFGLIELGHTAAAKNTDSPPAGFGRPPQAPEKSAKKLEDELDDEIPF